MASNLKFFCGHFNKPALTDPVLDLPKINILSFGKEELSEQTKALAIGLTLFDSKTPFELST